MLSGYTVSYAQYEEISTIKVGLYYGSTAQDTITLEADGGFNYGAFPGYFEHQGAFAETALSFSASDNILVANGVLSLGSEMALYPAAGYIRINGSAYRGGVLLRAEGAKITVINLVNIEEYLYGVVGNEMSASWNIEALKAQAVCARNFAMTNINKHASLGFNLCASTNCQVYRGLASEYDSVIRAVNETKGNLLMYNGSLAETLYFSCSGGHTANVKNVWGSDVPYLRGVEDPYENPSTTPRHSWSATLSSEDIKAALANSNIFIGDITGISTETDNTGRVYLLTVTGTMGSHTFKNSGTASPFSSYGVLSNKFSVTSDSSFQSAIKLFLKSGYQTVEASEYYVIDGTGSVQPAPMPFIAISANGKVSLNPFVSSAPSSYTFSGGGWGHGVGMSQYGAKGMADSGFTYSQILSHYYPGTYLETR